MRLKVARRHNGIGDWLMTLAALRWLRRQHADVQIVVDFANAPRLVQQAFFWSDLDFDTDLASPCTVAIEHLVYDVESDEPYLPGMARSLSLACDREVVPDLADLPFRGLRRGEPWPDLAIIAHGKGMERRGKDWGRENWAALARLLTERGHELRQVGGPRDCPIEVASYRYLDCSFAALVGVLVASRAFIGMENGLMVLAGFLRVPQVTLYDGARGAERVSFPYQLQVRERLEPPEVLRRIETWLSS